MSFCRLLVFTLKFMLVQLWVAGGGPTIEWSYLRRKIVREKRHLSEVMEIVCSCAKSGRISHELVSGKYFSITKLCLTILTTFKILDIT